MSGPGIADPLRLFELDDLGVSFDALRREVLPSFATLPWDEYDAKRQRMELLCAGHPDGEQLLPDLLPRYFADALAPQELHALVERLDADARRAFDAIRPYRRRALARFRVQKGPRVRGWTIQQLPDSDFSQSGDDEADYRTLPRRFATSPADVTDAPAYRAVIAQLATLVDEVCDTAFGSLQIACHQMSLIARPAAEVSNAPEGIHQDGSDYIVSALVLERSGIAGGESVVYGPDRRTEYLQHTLSEGQGIFQADVGSPLWHWVTPVHSSSPDSRGVRNVLGYDIRLE